MSNMTETIYVHKGFRFGQPEETLFEIDVPSNSTVLDVKHLLSEKLSTPVEKILLTISGRQITNEETCPTHIAPIIRK